MIAVGHSHRPLTYVKPIQKKTSVGKFIEKDLDFFPKLIIINYPAAGVCKYSYPFHSLRNPLNLYAVD